MQTVEDPVAGICEQCGEEVLDSQPYIESHWDGAVYHTLCAFRSLEAARQASREMVAWTFHNLGRGAE
jgi:hypothetical protein